MTTNRSLAPLSSILEANLTLVNLPVSTLVEYALFRNEGKLTDTGAFRATTGKYTGRSPKDKYIVDESSIHHIINWGP
ncbi:MAG: phosphoenolpyruvate carboxykinase (ATP), partial [Bacilli bacterium]